MSRTWSKLRALSLRDVTILAAATMLLPTVHVALRLLGFVRMTSVLGRLRTGLKRGLFLTPCENSMTQAQATAKWVAVAAHRGMGRANCLDQSVTLWWLLRVQGIDAQIQIGVRRAPNLEAHAWVVCSGVVLNDRQDIDTCFQPFAGPLIKDVPLH